MKLLLLTMLLLPACLLYAQKEMPDFGQFTDEEVALKVCDFDKDADAVVLFDVASSNYNDEHNLITNHRIRFKILKQKGIDKANIEIPYYSKDDFENISGIKANTYTKDDNGEIVMKQLDNKTIFRQKYNDRTSLLKFTLPNVKVGTIVDYSYDYFAKNYNGLDDWYFQSDVPVVLSRYLLTMIPNAEFTYVVHKSPDAVVKIKNDNSSGSVNYEMNNIAGLRDEPYMDASKDYLQHIEFQFAGYVNEFGDKKKFMTTWKESAHELLDATYFGKPIEKNLPGSEEIIAKASTLPVIYDKMKLIYEYVKSNFSWNNINSYYADDGIKSAWTNKKGTSGEINLILINLLKQAGLEVYPMLVSERDHGKVNTGYPIIEQFNKVVAYTVVDNKKFVLDGTGIYTPLNIIPFNILNTNAFIVDNKKAEVIKLTDEKSASNFINVYASIDSTGIITGSANISSYHYAKVNRLQDYRKNKEKFQHDYFERNGDIKIDSFEVTNTETDSLALQQQFNFTMPVAISGDYKLIDVNLFSGIEKNPFISEARFTDVDFGCLRRTDINETFELPANMKAEQMPKNVQLVTPDKSIIFIRFAGITDNIITIQMSLRVNQTLYTTADYPVLKEFYKKMYNMLDEQIVLSNR